MKKVLFFAGAGVIALVVFLSTLVVGVNMSGGVGKDSFLAGLPFVKVRETKKDEKKEKATSGKEGSESSGKPSGEKKKAVDTVVGSEDVGVPAVVLDPAALKDVAAVLQRKMADVELQREDIQREKRALEVLQEQIRKEREETLKVIGEKIAELKRLKREIAEMHRRIKSLQVSIAASERANVERIANIYAKMEPTKAASTLTSMYTSGKQDEVVKILYKMQERSAAKILNAVADPKLAADITERLSRVREESKGE